MPGVPATARLARSTGRTHTGKPSRQGTVIRPSGGRTLARLASRPLPVEGQDLSATVFVLVGGDPVALGVCSARRTGKGRKLDSRDRLSQTPLRPHLPPVRGQAGHARPDALAITEDDMDKLLLTPTEAATALGIGRSKVYELMRAGTLASVRIDTCHSIPAAELEALVVRLRRDLTAEGVDAVAAGQAR
jgi:excisionase family DNA binding protein